MQHLSGQANDQSNALLAQNNSPQTVNSNPQGAGDALYYLGGFSPASVLNAQGAAFKTAAEGLATQAKGLGNDYAGSALATGAQNVQKLRDDLMQIQAQRPGLLNQAVSALQQQQAGLSNDYADQQAKQQQLELERQAYGLKSQNQAFNQKLATAKYNLQVGNQKIALAKWNAQQKDKNNKIDAKVSAGINDGYAHNTKGEKVLDPKGKPIKFSPSAAGGSKASASQVNTFIKGLTTYSHVAGVSTPTGHTMKFGAALRRLTAPRSQGGYGLNNKTARQFLDGVYKRGEDGRAWLTNEEQSILRKSRGKYGYIGLSNRTKVNLDPVSHNAFLSPIQYQILSEAGMLPPGQMHNTPIGERWYIAQ